MRTAPARGRRAAEKLRRWERLILSSPRNARQSPLAVLLAALAAQNLRNITKTPSPANVEPAATRVRDTQPKCENLK